MEWSVLEKINSIYIACKLTGNKVIVFEDDVVKFAFSSFNKDRVYLHIERYGSFVRVRINYITLEVIYDKDSTDIIEQLEMLDYARGWV